MLDCQEAVDLWLSEIETDDEASAAVVSALSDCFECAGGVWLGTLEDLAAKATHCARRDLSRQDALRVTAGLIAAGYLDRSPHDSSLDLFEPKRAIACVDGPLAGCVYALPIFLSDKSRHELEQVAVYSYDEETDLLRFTWPLLGRVLFRGGPLEKELGYASEVKSTWDGVNVPGYSGSYARAADGHMDWIDSLPEQFDHDAFEREFAAYAEAKS